MLTISMQKEYCEGRGGPKGGPKLSCGYKDKRMRIKKLTPYSNATLK